MRVFNVIFFGFWKWLLVIVPLQLIGIVLLALVLPFIKKDSESLPKVFRLWDNFSGPKVDGLAGDWPFRVDTGMGETVKYNNEDPHEEELYKNPFWADMYYRETCGGFYRYWRRYVWLAWRNPVDVTKGVLLGKDITGLNRVASHMDATIDNQVYRRGMWIDPFSGGIKYDLDEVYWFSGSQRLRVGFKVSIDDIKYQSTHPDYTDKKYVRFEFSYSPFHRRK